MTDQRSIPVALPQPTAADEFGVAIRAVSNWGHGTATGDWSRFQEMLADNVRFIVPLDGFQGVCVGTSMARRFFETLAENIRTTMTVKNVLANGHQFAFEIRAEGHFQGRPFANQLLLVIVVDGGAVVGFREYIAWQPGTVEDQSLGRELFDG